MSRLPDELEESTSTSDKDVDIDCKFKYFEKCLCVNKSKFNSFASKFCEDYPNCYRKQLERKKKKCEKYEQALNEIEKYLDAQQKYFDGEDYHNLLDVINKAKEGNNNG